MPLPDGFGKSPARKASSYAGKMRTFTDFERRPRADVPRSASNRGTRAGRKSRRRRSVNDVLAGRLGVVLDDPDDALVDLGARRRRLRGLQAREPRLAPALSRTATGNGGSDSLVEPPFP